MMKRIFLTVAYDGTDYGGWQIQNNTVTIEGELNRALSELLGEEIKVIGGSRTDAGVHALCNIAVFDTKSRIAPDKISFAVNGRLNDDISVTSSREVAADFHPRRTNSIKTYCYQIYNNTVPLPTLRRYSHFVHRPLNVKDMASAAAFLQGEHDFKSFANIHGKTLTTIRNITNIDVSEAEHLIKITVSGTGFLYNMVRIIAGTLIEVGKGLTKPCEIEDILAAKDREAAGATAPAKGLTLIKYMLDCKKIMV